MENSISVKHKKRTLSQMINSRRYPFKQYVPVAGEMLSLIEQTNCLDERKEGILKRVIIGDSPNQIAEEMKISRQRVYQLELNALARLHSHHSPLVSRFDAFRRAEFSSKVAKIRETERSARNKQKMRFKARQSDTPGEMPSKKKTKKENKNYYKENKESILGSYHRNPEVMATRMLRELVSIENMARRLLTRAEKAKAHIKKYFPKPNNDQS